MNRPSLRVPKYSPLVVAAVSLALSATVALGLTVRHLEWGAAVVGKEASKIKGPASMYAGMADGTTDVVVKYTGDIAGAVRPWHVHVGSCTKGGAIFGDAKAYTALKVGSNGAAEGKATLRVVVPDSGNFYVNIHESAANMAKIVACGNLQLED